MSRFIILYYCIGCPLGIVLENREFTSETPSKKPGKAPSQDDGNESFTFVPAIEPFEDDPNFPAMNESLEAALPNPDHPVEHFMPIKGPRPSPQWRNRLLVWRQQKFAFCYIEKNACTQFNLLMNALNNLTGPRPWWRSQWYHFEHEYPVRPDGSRREGWRYAVFTRDPAERFLSAWSSKCQAWEDQGNNCLGDRRVEMNPTTAVIPFEKMVDTQLKTYVEHAEREGGYNAHYDPQTTFCGLRTSEYDFVGRLNGNYADVHNQVHDMLVKVAHVPENHSAMKNAMNHLFPRNRVSGHNTHAGNKMGRMYRNPRIYNKVCEVFAQDYSKLNFTRGHYVRRA